MKHGKAEMGDYRVMLKSKDHMIPNILDFCHVRHLSHWRWLENHTHPYIEVVAMLEGEQPSYFVNDEPFHLSGGDVIVTYPDEIHGLLNAPWTTGELLWLQIDCSDHRNLFGLSEEISQVMYRYIQNRHIRLWHAGQDMVWELCEAHRNLARSEKMDEYWVQGYIGLMKFLTHCFCRREEPDHVISDDIRQAMQYIRDHLNMELDISDVAAHVSLSTGYFKEKFKRETGVTPRHFIRIKVIEEIQTKLGQPDANMTEIAFQYGFGSSSYFSSVFRRITGYTPTEYRRIIGR